MFCTFSFIFIKGHTLTFSHVTICTHSFHNKIRWSNFIHKNVLDSVETRMQIWLITTRESNFKIDNVHIFANYFLNGYIMISSNIATQYVLSKICVMHSLLQNKQFEIKIVPWILFALRTWIFNSWIN